MTVSVAAVGAQSTRFRLRSRTRSRCALISLLNAYCWYLSLLPIFACQCIARLADAIVSGFSAAVQATRWVATHAEELGIDARRIAVCGDSAGGNLSAVVALLAKRAGAPKIAFQALVYPACGGDPAKHPSLTLYNKGYLLTEEDMQCAQAWALTRHVCYAERGG